MLRGFWIAGVLGLAACGGRAQQPGDSVAHSNEAGGSSSAAAGAASQSSGAAAGAAGRGGEASAGRAGTASGAGAVSEGGEAGASSGDAGASGGDAGAPACTPGAVRCVAIRERCDATGAWKSEGFTCAVDISGAPEQQMACAVKSDGRLICFGQDFNPAVPALVANTPAGKWSRVFLADDPADLTDHQLCGIDETGGGTCWNSQGNGRSLGGPLRSIATGSFGLCVVGRSGASYCPVDSSLIGPTSSTSPLRDLVLRNSELFALAADGSVIAPYPSLALPAGVYEQISASDSELCAISQDHQLVCAPNALPAELATQRFTQVALEFYGGMCAIREDHIVVCNSLSDRRSITPSADEFTHIVALSDDMCGIRTDGSIACFGLGTLTPPPGW